VGPPVTSVARRRTVVVHVAHSFEEADDWSIDQCAAMTVDERFAVYAELRRRIWGDDCPSVRESGFGEKRRISW